MAYKDFIQNTIEESIRENWDYDKGFDQKRYDALLNRTFAKFKVADFDGANEYDGFRREDYPSAKAYFTILFELAFESVGMDKSESSTESTGKGWKEAADHTGKAPRHKAAATKRQLKGITRTPMKKRPKSAKVTILKKWEADLKARRSWSGNKRGFAVFDSNVESESVEKLSEIMSKGQSGIDDYTMNLQEMNFDFQYESFKATWNEFLRDEHIDTNKLPPSIKSEVEEEARMTYEENLDWNIEKMFEFDVLLKDGKQYELGYDGSVSTIDEDVPDSVSFKNRALKYISQEELNKILINSYGGMGYFGMITSARDILDALRDDNKTITGSSLIIGVHDGMNGSGYFVRAEGKLEIDLKTAQLDEGSYSVGDVFGTREWNWR